MIRGTQREMIMLKGEKTSAFECVFFLVRTDVAVAKRAKEDMLEEATRIISQNRPGMQRKRVIFRREIKKRLPAFLLGALCGALSVFCVWLLT